MPRKASRARTALRRRPAGRTAERGNPARSAGPDDQGKRFWLLFWQLKKVTRPAGAERELSEHSVNQLGEGAPTPTLPRKRERGLSGVRGRYRESAWPLIKTATQPNPQTYNFSQLSPQPPPASLTPFPS